jgi:hypothetical protein
MVQRDAAIFEHNHLAFCFRVAIGLAVVLPFQIGIMSPAGAVALSGEFSGNAQSIELRAVTPELELQVGTAAHESCPCRGTHGATRQQMLASIRIGDLVTAGVTGATSFSSKTASTATTKQTATVSQLSLFGGLVTADALTASTSIEATPDGLSTSDAGTTIVNLVINGAKVSADVPDNTQISLPGIGLVTIKAVDDHAGTQSAGLRVSMLLVDVTQSNTLGLPVGARLVVARSSAGYARTQPAAALGGFASVAKLKASDGTTLDDPTGAGGVGLPNCSGSGGDILTKTVANISVPNLLSVAGGKVTAFGGPTGTTQVVKTKSDLTTISLLAGLITVKSLVAAAQETRMEGASTASAAGSGLRGLMIAGVSIGDIVKPNVKFTLPTIGALTVNEQSQTGDGLDVIGLHVVVTTANLLGLPIGAEIVVGHAYAKAGKF